MNWPVWGNRNNPHTMDATPTNSVDELQNQIAKLNWQLAFLRNDNSEMQMILSDTSRVLEMPADGSWKQGQCAEWARVIMAELKVWRQGGKPTPPGTPPV